jgi:4-hydroxy-tetrahydrodipicolinate synthase
VTIVDTAWLHGSFPPLVTPMINGQVAIEEFETLVAMQVERCSNGVVVTGTSGEPTSLSAGEREELYRAAVGSARGRIPVLAGVGAMTLEDTLDLVSRAERSGVSGLMVVTPFYSRPPQRGLIDYFERVAGATSLPIVLYHIPLRAAVDFQLGTVHEIVRRCPNVIGMKHSSEDVRFVADLVRTLGDAFRVLCGMEYLSLPMLAVGAVGIVSATGNLIPERVTNLCEAVFNGDLAEARRLYLDDLELNGAIFADTNPIPVKYMMHRVGLISSPEVRLPLAAIDNESLRRNLDGVLARSGLVGSGEDGAHAVR